MKRRNFLAALFSPIATKFFTKRLPYGVLPVIPVPLPSPLIISLHDVVLSPQDFRFRPGYFVKKISNELVQVTEFWPKDSAPFVVIDAGPPWPWEKQDLSPKQFPESPVTGNLPLGSGGVPTASPSTTCSGSEADGRPFASPTRIDTPSLPSENIKPDSVQGQSVA